MNKAILTIDIGNTSAKLGIFINSRLKKKFSIPTDTIKRKNLNRVAGILKKECAEHNIATVITASVVPETNRFIKTVLNNAFANARVITLKKNTHIGIVNKYRAPEQVGQDRLVTAMAAATLYGTPAIVIDIGTALTIDIVSKDSEYLGGIIYPGPHISAKALAEKTSLLPLVPPKPAKNLIGRNTAESIQNGLYYGMIEIITGIVKRFQTQYPELKKASLVATGGFIKEIREHLPKKMKIDEDLILKGLNIIAIKNT